MIIYNLHDFIPFFRFILKNFKNEEHHRHKYEIQKYKFANFIKIYEIISIANIRLIDILLASKF